MGKKKTSIGRILRRVVIIAAATIIVLCAAIIGLCLFGEKPAVQTVSAYQSAFAETEITVSKNGDVEIRPAAGDANQTGIIFYAGAPIRPEAYIPLMARLAENGYTCFIPKLTGNIASFEPSAALTIICDHPAIQSWYAAGHSMGGLTAAGFAVDHPDLIDGMILIAAYAERNMKDSGVPVLSIFGDADGVLNAKRYENSLSLYPEDFEEHILPGANHAQYGDYGKQPRDNDAVITGEEQREQTAAVMLDWLSRHGK